MKVPVVLSPSTSAEFVKAAREQIGLLFNGRINQATARVSIKAVCGFHGPIASDDIDRMLETSVVLMRGAHDWLRAQSEATLDRWPAQALVNVTDADAVAGVAEYWRTLGGKLYSGRLVALKNDPIWAKLSPLGLPYPPFGLKDAIALALEDVDREEAEGLGLLNIDQLIDPETRDLEADLEHAERATLGKTANDFDR